VRRILFLTHDDAMALDLIGPLEVFAVANRFGGEYALEIRSPKHEFSTMAGLTMRAHGLVSDPAPSDLHTVVVCGGEGTRDVIFDAAYIQHVRRLAERAQRVASVCSGAFVLARAGLLKGRRATTHWAHCRMLAQHFPDVEVDADAIFVRDGNVWTSAGVTAGMDLALALVEADHGREVALTTARQLVLFVQRPGGQSQFSAQLARQRAQRQPLEELCVWIAEHVEEDLRIDVLAKRVAMSPRHFRRVFRQEVGVSPARYVENVRLEVARRLLETTAMDLVSVAEAAGFGTDRTLRRAFQRRLGVAPNAYRSRFRGAA